MTTPNETHMRAAEEIARFSGQWFSKEIAACLAKHFPTAPASPATPSGTPSDAELVDRLKYWADRMDDFFPPLEREKINKQGDNFPDRGREAASRITALSAQVAELERDKARIIDVMKSLTLAVNVPLTKTERERILSQAGAAMNHQGPK